MMEHSVISNLCKINNDDREEFIGLAQRLIPLESNNLSSEYTLNCLFGLLLARKEDRLRIVDFYIEYNLSLLGIDVITSSRTHNSKRWKKAINKVEYERSEEIFNKGIYRK